jgi:hypothetical protein
MIFRDKKTGTLLNIRRDEYINDHLYFQELIRITSDDHQNGRLSPKLRYTRPFDEVITEEQPQLKPR